MGDCPICDSQDDWEPLDYLKSQKGLGFVICKTCGFCTYLNTTPEDLEDFYAKSTYNPNRKTAGTLDYYTKLNKLAIHRAFIGPYLADHPSLRIIDIGCSTGYLLKMCRDEYGHFSVFGTEWYPAHAKFGQYAYELKIDRNIEDFGEQTYDLICMEQVLEHIAQPDRFLTRLVSDYSSPHTCFYVAVPIWFDILGQPALNLRPGPGLERVLPPDHINVFSRQSLSNLYAKVGLSVIRDNYTCYGYRALLTKTDGPGKMDFEDYLYQIDSFEHQKRALDCYADNRFAEARRAYARFPDAIAKDIDNTYPQAGNDRIGLLKKAYAEMPNVAGFPRQIGHDYFVLNNLDQALKYYREAIDLLPSQADVLWQMAQAYIAMGAFESAAAIFEAMLAMYPQLQFFPLKEGESTCLDRLSFCYNNIKDDIYG